MLVSQRRLLVSVHPFLGLQHGTALLNRTVLGDACMRLTVELLPEPLFTWEPADGNMTLARRFAKRKNQ